MFKSLFSGKGKQKEKAEKPVQQAALLQELHRRQERQEHSSELEVVSERCRSLEHELEAILAETGLLRREEDAAVERHAEHELEFSAAERDFEVQRAECEEADEADRKANAVVKELKTELGEVSSESSRLRTRRASLLTEAGEGDGTDAGTRRECLMLEDEHRQIERERHKFLESARARTAKCADLEATAGDFALESARAEAETRQLMAELRHMEADAHGDDEVGPTRIRAGSGSLSNDASEYSIQEVWRLQSEEHNATNRVHGLEQELEDVVVRRRQFLAEAAAKSESHTAHAEATCGTRILAPRRGSRPALSQASTEQLAQNIDDRLTVEVVGNSSDEAVIADVHCDMDRAAPEAASSIIRRRRSSATARWAGEGSPHDRRSTHSAEAAPGTLEADEGSPDAGTVGIIGSPQGEASRLVAENGKLRAEADALREALALAEGVAGPVAVHPPARETEGKQLEAVLSFSRSRLRGMLQQQLQDSRRLLTSLQEDIAEAERRLRRERIAREDCEQRLHAAEGREPASVSPTRICEAAAGTPPPLPPPLSYGGSCESDLDDDDDDGDEGGSSCMASPLEFSALWAATCRAHDS